MENTHRLIAQNDSPDKIKYTPLPTDKNDSSDKIKYSPLPTNIISPVNVDVLEQCLTNHPDRNLVNFIIHGFTFGFDILYSGSLSQTSPNNLLSARSHQNNVSAAIAKEVSRGHTSGPFLCQPFPVLHCSPLGAVPKKDNTYRIILDLSSPRGSSINDGIPPDICSVHYSRFDDAVDLVLQHGSTTYMAKLDIRHAFRLCPVRPQDWPLLGYYWDQHYYVDTRLPFGSRSSPFIFNNFADILTWILIYVYGIPAVLHYLDDFFLCAVNQGQCKQHMLTLIQAFNDLGVPLAPEKIVGPATSITYLGIEIDAKLQIIRLPPDKLNDLSILLSTWKLKRKCTKRELLSLIGSLSFACKVVKPGRIFLRRLIDLSTSVSRLNHHITINSEAQADIHWWNQFLSSWNGIEFIQSKPVSSDSLNLFTDASGLGFGAVFRSKWFSVGWPASYNEQHINFKELFALVAAIFTWGSHLRNKQVVIHTDNLPITQIWHTGSSRDKMIMKLIRALFLYCATNNINLLTKHIPGIFNCDADDLSRLQVAAFHRRNPTANQMPTPVAEEVWHI